MYKRLSERLPDVFLKKLDVSEQRILYLKQTDFDDKQQDDENAYSLELFIISAVNHTRYIAFLQFGNIIIQCSFRIAGIIYMNVLTLACLGKFLAHLLIQGGHYGVARIVLQIRAVAHRYWRSLGVSYAQDKDIDSFLVGSSRCLLCARLMVFAISNYDDGSAHILLLSETLGS